MERSMSHNTNTNNNCRSSNNTSGTDVINSRITIVNSGWLNQQKTKNKIMHKRGHNAAKLQQQKKAPKNSNNSRTSGNSHVLSQIMLNAYQLSMSTISSVNNNNNNDSNKTRSHCSSTSSTIKTTENHCSGACQSARIFRKTNKEAGGAGGVCNFHKVCLEMTFDFY